jgi:hypothetical protein
MVESVCHVSGLQLGPEILSRMFKSRR